MVESTASAVTEDPVFAMHRGGKISVRPTVDVTDRYGLAMAYTPWDAPAAAYRPWNSRRRGLDSGSKRRRRGSVGCGACSL